MDCFKGLISSFVLEYAKPFLPIWIQNHPNFLHLCILFLLLLCGTIGFIIIYCWLSTVENQPKRLSQVQGSKISEQSNGQSVNINDECNLNSERPVIIESTPSGIAAALKTIVECFLASQPPSVIDKCIERWITAINQNLLDDEKLLIILKQDYVSNGFRLCDIKLPCDKDSSNLRILANVALVEIKLSCTFDDKESLKILLKNFEGLVEFSLILNNDSSSFNYKCRFSEPAKFEFSIASDTFIETRRIEQLRDRFTSILNKCEVDGCLSTSRGWYSDLVRLAVPTLRSTSQRQPMLLCLVSALLPTLQFQSSQSEHDKPIVDTPVNQSRVESCPMIRSKSLPAKSKLTHVSKTNRTTKRIYPRFKHDPIKEEIAREEEISTTNDSRSSLQLSEVEAVSSVTDHSVQEDDDSEKLHEAFWRSVPSVETEGENNVELSQTSIFNHNPQRSQLADTSSSSATTNEDGDICATPMGDDLPSDPQLTPSNFDPGWIASVPRRLSAAGTAGSDFDEEGSPFHGRVQRAKKLLIKVISASDLVKKDSYCRNAFCVVEVNEPYQRHVTHLANKTSNPYWDQHYLFEINQNSRKILLEVFDKTKQKKVHSFGRCVLYLSSLTGDSSMRLSLPLNKSSASYPPRPSERWDGMDSLQPILVVEIQFMEPTEHTLPTFGAVPPPLTKPSSSEVQNVSFIKVENLEETTTQPKYFFPSSELEPVPEIMVTRSTPEPEYENKRLLSSIDETVGTKSPSRSASLSAPSPKRSRSFVSRLRRTLPIPKLKKKSLSDENLAHRSEPDKKTDEFDPSYPTEQVAHLTSTSNLSKMKTLSSSLRKLFLPKKGKDYFPALQNPIFRLEQSLDTDSFDAISNEGFLKIAQNDTS